MQPRLPAIRTHNNCKLFAITSSKNVQTKPYLLLLQWRRISTAYGLYVNGNRLIKSYNRIMPKHTVSGRLAWQYPKS